MRGRRPNTATIQYDELLARFEAEVPNRQENAGLLSLIEEATGGRRRARANRLLYRIGRPRRATVPRPTAKRFILPTPGSMTARNTSVGFADGQRSPSPDADDNAVSESGGPLGWYDPDQPVTIAFTRIGGER